MSKGKGKPRKASHPVPSSTPRLTTLSTEYWTIFWIDPGAEGTIVHIIENHIAAATEEAATGVAQAQESEESL